MQGTSSDFTIIGEVGKTVVQEGQAPVSPSHSTESQRDKGKGKEGSPMNDVPDGDEPGVDVDSDDHPSGGSKDTPLDIDALKKPVELKSRYCDPFVTSVFHIKLIIHALTVAKSCFDHEVQTIGWYK